ncbi:hypothetical protein [Nitrosomonas sp.]|uniref:hypothetical protein n=1 Tax=Nitrosomonas sp. TaxID=42353 RepID=UPI0025F58CDF|nr:hypothetical protein [Nitrosomonas sp.]
MKCQQTLVIAPAITPACNDREQIKPMLDQLTQLPAALGKIKYLLTDNSFYSAANTAACEAHGIEPLMAVGGESQHPGPFEWFTEPPVLPDNASPAQRMAHKLKSQAGRKCTYCANKPSNPCLASSNP